MCGIHHNSKCLRTLKVSLVKHFKIVMCLSMKINVKVDLLDIDIFAHPLGDVGSSILHVGDSLQVLICIAFTFDSLDLTLFVKLGFIHLPSDLLPASLIC